ncbi:MAG: rhodanese-like domain-containing protein [Chloroflexi bacterium]|nr:rhodanese-like domain-containing protein [Chloroflexota bacterium]
MPTKDPLEPFFRVSVQEAKDMIDKGNLQIVDVREPNEYASGHIAGALLIPVGSVLARRAELSSDKEILFVCKVGQRSALACEMASAVGRAKLFNLEGGTDAWIAQGYSVVNGDTPS